MWRKKSVLKLKQLLDNPIYRKRCLAIRERFTASIT